MKLKELIAPNGSSVICGNPAALDREATGISHDSREVLPGMVFAAIRGSRADGGDFIKDAVAKGAVCVVTEKAPADLPENVVCVVTDDVKKALACLSARFYKEPSKNLKLAGVTGTNGKTTVSYLVESIFRTSGKISGLIGTVGYRYGSVTLPSPFTTPQAPQLQRLLKEMETCGVTHCVMEVSSHSLSEKRVDFIKFDAKVFTNLTPEHLDYHLTMEAYYGAKARFFTSSDFSSGTGVINIDDKWGMRLKKETPGSLSYSLKTGAPMTGVNPMMGVNALVHLSGGLVQFFEYRVNVRSVHHRPERYVLALRARTGKAAGSEELHEDFIGLRVFCENVPYAHGFCYFLFRHR